MTRWKTLAFVALWTSPAMADPAEIVDVRAVQSGGTWRFDVSVLHPDTGWDHYADGWVVLAPDGTQLGERPLAHPHENEQPFTRSVSGVVIPEGISSVIIRAHCNIDGYTGADFVVALDRG